MALFCTHCGNPIKEGALFCIKCGAPAPTPPALRPAAPPPVPVAPTLIPAAAAPPPAPQPKSGGNLFLKIVAVVLGFIALATVVGIGSCVYIGYRVKKKADQVQQAYRSNDLGKIAEVLGGKSTGGGAHKPPKPLSFPAWSPAAAAALPAAGNASSGAG